ncbi:MAG TPA: ATP-binding protein [Vicinamibacterales bacterium]|jgi:anti-sigma regulatory factor (Ser/Thr protein kinase)
MGRVLVIGNDSALTGALRASHHMKSHEVETCDGQFHAALLVRSRGYDVVITDRAAAPADDLELVRELTKLRPGLRAIVVAPSLSSTDVISALRQQVYACFTRPVDYEELADLARGAIEDPDWRNAIQVVSGLPYWITLRVTCRLVTADRLTRFMTEHQSNMPSAERDLLITAFREMLLNAMEHGAGFDAEKVIEVTAAQTARALVFHFRDPGDGFDRDDLSHAAATSSPDDVIKSALQRAEDGRRPGGFGMLIVRQIVDELVYNERGNEVLMIKHLK